MPLQTETWTVDEALNDLDDQIADLAEMLSELEPGTERYEALASRADNLEYRADGLVWMRDEAGWGDFDVEFGGLTAGESAQMHRHMPDDPVPQERRLWYVAAGSVAGPHVGDGIEGTFETLATECHDGFVQWAESKVNSLATPEDSEGKSRLRTHLSEMQAEATSETDSDSTISS